MDVAELYRKSRSIVSDYRQPPEVGPVLDDTGFKIMTDPYLSDFGKKWKMHAEGLEHGGLGAYMYDGQGMQRYNELLSHPDYYLRRNEQASVSSNAATSAKTIKKEMERQGLEAVTYLAIAPGTEFLTKDAPLLTALEVEEVPVNQAFIIDGNKDARANSREGLAGLKNDISITDFDDNIFDPRTREKILPLIGPKNIVVGGTYGGTIMNASGSPHEGPPLEGVQNNVNALAGLVGVNGHLIAVIDCTPDGEVCKKAYEGFRPLGISMLEYHLGMTPRQIKTVDVDIEFYDSSRMVTQSFGFNKTIASTSRYGDRIVNEKGTAFGFNNSAKGSVDGVRGYFRTGNLDTLHAIESANDRMVYFHAKNIAPA